ncbi:MAG TPA: FAD-dependent oxidoreductase [Candidatus Babeliaceae bacterium]|nr:FAD-dependent oxidoreductase [Candidatus Babeliaceae bacterium]
MITILRIWLIIALFTVWCTENFAELEIRSIRPPRLETSHLGKRILCHRPMRCGSPDMSVKFVTIKGANPQVKIVATNAGHGGSGWTLGPGCAAYVNNMLINYPESRDLNHDTPITIIGAGALGLFTAYDLVQRGYANITVMAEKFDNLTSHNAGGLLAPVSMDNDPEMQVIINQIGIDAYKFYAEIAKSDGSSLFNGGAVIVPTYFLNREDSGLEPYVDIVMKPAKDVVLDFGNGTMRQMVVYDDGIFIDTAKMMASLRSYLESRVVFIQQKITDFAQIADKYIINCTGLGSRELNHDAEFIPVQGHLIMLKDQDPADLQYMILVYFGEYIVADGQKVKRSFYIFPKKLAGSDAFDIGVIGGTFIEGATDETPNAQEFDILIQGARDFYGVTY